MIGVEHLRRTLSLLVFVLLANVLILYLIYQDLQPALVVPSITSLLSFLFGIFIESGDSHFYTRQPRNADRGLIPLRRFFSGLTWPLFFAWDDILLQSDELGKPWFWSMVASSYTGWLIGIAVARYRVMRKDSEIPQENDESDIAA